MSELVFAIFIFSFLAFFSFRKIKNSKSTFGFIYPWAWPLGAFVWEDLFVFSILGVSTSLLVYILNDIRIGYIGFLIFWIVRSLGESIYFFLQQFFQSTEYPHTIEEHFKVMRKFFGDISDQKCYILLQVFHQSVIVLCSILLVLLFLYW